MIDKPYFSISKSVVLEKYNIVKSISDIVSYSSKTNPSILKFPSFEELKTICKCGQKAIANGRKIGGRFVFEGDQVAIEGEASVEYESLCARCYFKYKKEYEDRKRSFDGD